MSKSKHALRRRRSRQQRENRRHNQRAEVMAVYFMNLDVLAHPDILDKLIVWRSGSPAYQRRMGYSRKNQERSTIMQRQFTIELRVDYADNGKHEVMRTALQQAAQHVYATASLLTDQVKPQIAVFSDDFFTGNEKIELLEDTIAKGKEEISEETPVSDELMAALR